MLSAWIIEETSLPDIDTILAHTNIEGLDINEALGRLNNSSKIYMRIIHSFTTNMPAMLDEFIAVTQDNLPEYSIKIHGAKGSCYGIGAVACGDAAFALEKASKEGNWDFVVAENSAFIESVRVLISRLLELEAQAEGVQAQGSSVPSVSAPDPEMLAALLDATREYDVETMLSTIEALEAQSYTSGGDMVTWLREQFDNFAYDNIVERLSSL